jgi:SAM-dependent methyltransferase
MNDLLPSAAFAEEVEAYVQPFVGTFGYEAVKNGHLDISRFYPICQMIAAYKSIAGSVVFSSGCGSAGDLAVCLELGAKQGYGIEVDEGLLKLAMARFQDSPVADRVDLRHYRGKELPYPDQAFDLILSLHVVEHVQDVDLYLRELFRVLRSGGILFLELPNRYYWQEQHTQLPLVHILPNPWRNRLIGILLSPLFRHRVGERCRQKLEALLDLLHPTPFDLVTCFRRHAATYQLQLVEACFYASAQPRLMYSEVIGLSGWRRLWQMPTFRLVIGKAAD